MNIRSLLDTLDGLGVAVTRTAAGSLRLEPASRVPAELLAAVREHKTGVLELLRGKADLITLLEALPLDCPTGPLYLAALTASGYPYTLEWTPSTWPPALSALEAQALKVRAYVMAAEARTLALYRLPPSPVVGWRLTAGTLSVAQVAPDDDDTLGESSAGVTLARPA